MLHFLSLVYINDLTDNISSTIKLFADDSTLFARVWYVGMYHHTINTDLDHSLGLSVEDEVYPEINKHTIEVIFSHRRKNHLTLSKFQWYSG